MLATEKGELTEMTPEKAKEIQDHLRKTSFGSMDEADVYRLFHEINGQPNGEVNIYQNEKSLAVKLGWTLARLHRALQELVGEGWVNIEKNGSAFILRIRRDNAPGEVGLEGEIRPNTRSALQRPSPVQLEQQDAPTLDWSDLEHECLSELEPLDWHDLKNGSTTEDHEGSR